VSFNEAATYTCGCIAAGKASTSLSGLLFREEKRMYPLLINEIYYKTLLLSLNVVAEW
jgi:hypothetical protein